MFLIAESLFSFFKTILLISYFSNTNRGLMNNLKSAIISGYGEKGQQIYSTFVL